MPNTGHHNGRDGQLRVLKPADALKSEPFEDLIEEPVIHGIHPLPGQTDHHPGEQVREEIGGSKNQPSLDLLIQANGGQQGQQDGQRDRLNCVEKRIFQHFSQKIGSEIKCR